MTSEEEIMIAKDLMPKMVREIKDYMEKFTKDKSPCTRDTMIASALTELLVAFLTSKYQLANAFMMHDELYKLTRMSLRNIFKVMEDK